MSENTNIEAEGSSGGGSQLPSVQQLTADMMKNPDIWMALQHQLNKMVGHTSGYVENLPKSIQRRIHALKNLQVESSKIESKFYAEVHELERKYAALYHPIFDKRSEIVSGMYEPMEEECEWKESREEETDASQADVSDAGKGEPSSKSSEPKGIPSFWLTIFKNVPALQELVQKHDEPVLEKLVDIKVRLSTPGEPMAFTLEFYFDANDFFTNSMLTKRYDLQTEPNEESPFSFEGPEIVSCSGCEIDWKPGQNVTVEPFVNTSSGSSSQMVNSPRCSFFHFFTPPESSAEEEEEEELMESDAAEDALTRDFEIGHLIRDRIVPFAVLYFTGEADNPADEEEDEEEEEEEDGDDEDDNKAEAGSEASSNSDNDPDFELDENANDNAQGCKQQ